MAGRSIRVIRQAERLLRDDRRVIPRYLDFAHGPRIRSIARRVLKIPPRRVPAVLHQVMRRFSARHRDLRAAFRDSFSRTAPHLKNLPALSEPQKLLLGACLTMEYSIEAAALFNPSIVPHPDQADLPAGAVRFLLTLRATGEGHVSSIVFRRGVLDRACRVTFDPAPRYAYAARPVPDRLIHQADYLRRLRDHGLDCPAVRAVLEALPEPFTLPRLKQALAELRRGPALRIGSRPVAGPMWWMAEANYELRFPEDCLPAEIVIFPATANESRGMEDVRLVRFVDDDGRAAYTGTYTAYDGVRIRPMLLQTDDFHGFHISTLHGRCARNKGMALFPRKVGGSYVMLSRHDGENLYVLRSHDLYVWNRSRRLQSPREEWELVQVGNCGSPIETEAGWLVVTHGVGPLRRYCIGALLLDLAEPERVIGRLRRPLLAPTVAEREGYVPNVLYSCGSMIHGRRLVIPYAMSDSRVSFATVSVRCLLRRLLDNGP